MLEATIINHVWTQSCTTRISSKTPTQKFGWVWIWNIHSAVTGIQFFQIVKGDIRLNGIIITSGKWSESIEIGEVGAILTIFKHIFFQTDHPTMLHELFELRPFMQTVLPHNTTLKVLSSYPVPQNQQFWHHFCSIRIAMTFGAILIPTLKNWHSINQNKDWYLPKEASGEPNSDKMVKSVDYSGKGIFWLFL